MKLAALGTAAVVSTAALGEARAQQPRQAGKILQLENIFIQPPGGEMLHVPRIIDWHVDPSLLSSDDPLTRVICLPNGTCVEITMEITRFRNAARNDEYITTFYRLGERDVVIRQGGYAVDSRGWFVRIDAGISG
jgi:hypothetical protein